MNDPHIISAPGIILICATLPLALGAYLAGWIELGTVRPQVIRRPVWTVFIATLTLVVLDSVLR